MHLNSILSHNRLERPDGRPLFRYRVPQELLLPLEEEVRSEFRNTSTREGAPLFCLWASRKLRSLNDEIPGHLSWNLLGLGPKIGRNLMVAWTDLGFSYLRRPIHRSEDESQLRLYSLYLEGGIPLRQLQKELWSEVKELFGSLRHLGNTIELAMIYARVTETLPDLPGLKSQALTILLRGLLLLDRDLQFQSTFPSAWSESTRTSASTLLNVELVGDLSWLDSLLKETPRVVRRRTCEGEWLVARVSDGGHGLTFNYRPDLPKKLLPGELLRDTWIYINVDQRRHFVGRYERTALGPILQDQRSVVYDPADSWNSVRLEAEDEDEEPSKCPVSLKKFERPGFPCLVRREGGAGEKWLLVPNDWTLERTSGAVETLADWKLCPFEASLRVLDPQGFEYQEEQASQNPVPPLDGWQSLEGVLFGGKPVRTSLPGTLKAWSRDRDNGLVRFRYRTEAGKIRKRVDEVILPGLSVEGRIFPPSSAQVMPKVSWTVRVPAGWAWTEDGIVRNQDGDLWKFQTNFRLDRGEEAGEPFTFTDTTQTLTLTCFASPQIFLSETEYSPFLADKTSTLWEKDVGEKWWVFKTKRVKKLVVNDVAFDQDIPEDVSARPGQILLRSLVEGLVPEFDEGDPLRRFRAFRLRVHHDEAVHTSGYHDELNLSLENCGVYLAS